MLLTSTVASQLPSCWYHIPSHFNIHQHHIQQKRKLTTLSLANSNTHIPLRNFFGLSLRHTHNCNKGQENSNRSRYNSDYSNHNHNHHLVLFTNMWWVDVKAAVGQRINLEAILCSTMVILKDPKLALPHISVPDIRYIDWAGLRRKGFKGVVFDKDNTITAPYSLTPWPSLESSLQRCKSEFGPDIAIFSNSAGLNEYDHDGSKARMLEGAIGIKVIRHRRNDTSIVVDMGMYAAGLKKPAGTAEEIEKHFGCESSKIIMVGDRPFTDIVYGNRNGFLTILTEPLSLAEEPFIVKQVRKLETSFVSYWSRRGLKPLGHKLLPDPMRCVKEPRPIFKS